MKHLEREKKFRKQFWFSFLIIPLPICLLISGFGFGKLSNEVVSLIIFAVIAIYIAGYISGYTQGREMLRQVLDFMEPSLRWKVEDAKHRMEDEVDSEYNKMQKKY